MRADLALDVDDPATVAAAVSPSLRDSDTVGFDVETGDDLAITVEGRSLGALRGGVNTALMLTRLATKFDEQG